MNSFADRDMLMRYIGGAVGHITTAETSRTLAYLSSAYADAFAARRNAELRILRPRRDYERHDYEMADADHDMDDIDDSELDDGAKDDPDDADYASDGCGYNWDYPQGKSRNNLQDNEQDEDEDEIEAEGYRED